MKNVTAFDTRYNLDKMDKPVDKTEWGMTPQTVNAYYNPLNNEIVFPAACLSELRDGQLIFLPYIVKADNGVKVVVAESDVENYPGMFVEKGSKENGMDAVFAPCPKTVKQGGHNELEQIVTETEDYIALAKPKQKFPWRIISVSAEDKDILDNDMVFRLAAPSRLADASWVKPGKVAWDWWNNWGLYKVPFKAGINTQTYKYYIDFAAKHGIEYVILDEGWAVNKKADLFQVVPEIDLKGIVDYGKQKGVDIILWAGYKAFDRDMERVCQTYAAMGVKGYKVDFINRNDAEVMNFLYKAAETCAKYKQVLDFHGICPPTGLTRTWPNVINFEGVNGQEQNWTCSRDLDIRKVPSGASSKRSLATFLISLNLSCSLINDALNPYI